jgi:hypothetical protein
METKIERSRFLSPALRRIVRGYGLLILIAIGFLLLAMFVHEAPKTVPAKGLGVVSGAVL